VPTPYGPDHPPFVRPPRPSLFRRAVPVSAHLGRYGSRYLRPDVLAGITVAALAIPSGMAYAEVAGLSPVAGLYALLLPAVAYALLGSSRQLIVGPEAALALLVGSIVTPMAAGDPARAATLAAMLALLTGAVYLVAFVVRLGWIADYFSRPVLVGYIHGIVVVLVVGQLEKLLGLSIAAEDPVPQLVEIVREIGEASVTTMAVGAVAIAALFLLRRYLPAVPAPLVVVVGAIAASGLLDLASHGVATVGDIASGLPSVVFPSVGGDDLLRLLPGALALFCVGYADGVLTARSFAGRHGQSVRANQEMLALGAANAAAGLTQSFSVGASGSRTAVNDQTGGRTQVVGIIAAGVIALVLLFLTQPVELLPKAVLGAVIIVAALGLVDLDEWRALHSSGTAEVVIAAATMLGVVLVGVLWGLLLAVALSIVHTTSRSARPHDAVLGFVPRLGRYADASTHPSARLTVGVVVYRLDDRLFYANAAYVRARILEAIDGARTPTRWLVFDTEGVPSVDSTGTEMLDQLLDQLDVLGIQMALARTKGPLHHELEAAGITARIGEQHIHPNIQAAVAACAEEAEP
jgi:high affinity sulfate transporter 1